MAYVIEYYNQGAQEDSATSSEALPTTMQLAREELTRRTADFALIIDDDTEAEVGLSARIPMRRPRLEPTLLPENRTHIMQ